MHLHIKAASVVNLYASAYSISPLYRITAFYFTLFERDAAFLLATWLIGANN